MLVTARVTLLYLSLAIALPLSLAATLFEGGTVIAFDDTTQRLRVIRDGAVLVDGNTITGVYSSNEVRTLPPDTETVDITGDIISTGFVDTHRHVWQTAYRSIGSNTSLAEYLVLYSPFGSPYRAWTPDDIYISQLMGWYDALNGGTTTILDHAHGAWTAEHSQAALQATFDSGARAFWSYWFQGQPLPDTITFDEQIAFVTNLSRSGVFDNSPSELGIAYDAFTPNDPAGARRVLDLARELNVSSLSTHAMLGPYGVENNPSDVNSFGFLNQSIPVIFGHASYITESDSALLRQYNHYISITPESEMHFGHDHPVTHLVQDQASLGVDCGWTYSGDILTQARIWLQVVRRTLYREVLQRRQVPSNNPMSVEQAFLLATRNGGLALRRPDIGVLAEGAKADLLVWNGQSLNMLGWDDPVAAVILHANIGDLKHVMVDGVFKKRDYKLLVEGYEALRSRFLETARKIQAVYKDAAKNITYEGANQIGSVYVPTFEADVLRGSGTGY
ncbi:hypothetical protein CAC42_7777 [Sphaceloma murrayae]|uniref:Amidohydrolase-related domain-containing protein n=1 Tax=Sphaceloma murrayae TaxID=2082308 RepID=A0A2K1QXU5_9PEZI|nr:hypothetical protein CAC42_7777 [Sphaceloma murrayae]